MLLCLYIIATAIVLAALLPSLRCGGAVGRLIARISWAIGLTVAYMAGTLAPEPVYVYAMAEGQERRNRHLRRASSREADDRPLPVYFSVSTTSGTAVPPGMESIARRLIQIDDCDEHKLVAPVIDHKGRPIVSAYEKDRRREFVRCPAKVFGLLGNEDMIVQDWNGDGDPRNKPVLPKKGTLFGAKKDDKEYVLDFSGSAAKDRRIPLVAKEKVFAHRYMESAEQSVYGTRFFLTNARRAVRGKLKVGIRPEGYVLANGDVVADGWGHVSAEAWKALIGAGPIRTTDLDRQPRDSFQLYRMLWASIKDEAIPQLQESMDTILTRTENFFRKTLAGFEDKMELIGTDEEMAQHPICVNAYTRESRLAVAAASYSVPFQTSHYKIAMPIVMPKSAGPVAFEEGYKVLGRYPFSSNAAVRSYHIGPEAAEIYRKRVANAMGIQYTLVALTDSDPVQVGAKGMSKLTATRYMEGCDIIICDKDIKMGAVNGKPNKKRVASMKELVLNDGYLGAIQVYGRGAFFGITIDEWLGFPGDFDGDGGVIYDCQDFMSFWRAIRDLKRKPNRKIVNITTPFSPRNVSIKAWQVMNSYLGELSNIMSSTFAMEDRDKLAQDMGFSDAEAMDERIAYLLQIEVDRYKKNTAAALKSDMKFYKSNDPDRVMGKIVQALSRNLVTAISRVAPWTGWKRNEDVFRFYVPRIWEPGLDKNQAEEAIPPFWNGAVPEMLKITLPAMGEALELAATVRPLGYFYSWAPEVSPELEGMAKKVTQRFARELVQVNETSEGAIDIFRDRWVENMKKWEKASGLPSRVLAAALWRASHQQDAQFSSAVITFWVYPKWAHHFVADKPGLIGARKAKVIGLNKRIPTNGGPDLLVDIQVKISDIKLSEIVGNSRRVRLARVVRTLEPDAIPLNPEGITRVGYPADYLCEIPFDGVVYPPEGDYTASFKKVSRASWVMELRD
jgi:hypothetical protein